MVILKLECSHPSNSVFFEFLFFFSFFYLHNFVTVENIYFCGRLEVWNVSVCPRIDFRLDLLRTNPFNRLQPEGRNHPLMCWPRAPTVYRLWRRVLDSSALEQILGA